MDYYQVFDLPRTATQDEITKKYRVLAKQYHPDRNPGDKSAEDKFKEISAAYDVIGDPEKRAFYDSHGHAPGRRSSPPPPQPSTVNASDFYKSVFGTFFGGDVRGRHVQVRLEVDLEDVLKESTHSIVYSKRKVCTTCRGCGASSFKPCQHCLGSGQITKTDKPPFVFTTSCPHCQGQGKTDSVRCADCSGSGYGLIKDCKLDVKIPAGIDQGMQVRVRGAGEDGASGDPPGDLFVVVLIKPHEFFSRDGANLTIEIPVSYSTLVSGGEILIPTLDKTFMSVKVPPGTQNGTRFRLKGRGMPDIQKPKTNGDILASVKLEVPQGLDAEYTELMEKLREFESKNPSPKVKAYADRVK